MSKLLLLLLLIKKCDMFYLIMLRGLSLLWHNWIFGGELIQQSSKVRGSFIVVSNSANEIIINKALRSFIKKRSIPINVIIVLPL